MPSLRVVKSLMLLVSVLVFAGCGSPSTGVNKVAINSPEGCCRNLYCTSEEDSQEPPQFFRNCASISAFDCSGIFEWTLTDCQNWQNEMMSTDLITKHESAKIECERISKYGGPC